ncbi:MAG: tRNA (adenosine(37)-N6)-threonylcarbamoyltransferase complex ATPase subunit type 1 TsaE [Paracoccaceae bacterium]|nr:tRNA (adenosine(37)-N6)-threonylcarbamoyltransferase complex ATPase subunit type 1 TsaE [Paracoccaceae bacterium]
MAENSLSLVLRSGDATASAAALLASQLRSGDTILLHGTIGAGKTHFARAIVQSLLTAPEDVPSPTFTLVQTYQTRFGPLWHSDLYRIGAMDEIEELGLLDAFDVAICLVEWPDRLGTLCPASALNIWLEDGTNEDERKLTATWVDTRWDPKMTCWTKL